MKAQHAASALHHMICVASICAKKKKEMMQQKHKVKERHGEQRQKKKSGTGEVQSQIPTPIKWRESAQKRLKAE